MTFLVEMIVNRGGLIERRTQTAITGLGNRQANTALYRLVHEHMRWQPPTTTYGVSRRAEGRSM